MTTEQHGSKTEGRGDWQTLLHLSDELCEAVDNAGLDIGGGRGSLTILRDIGPVVSRLKRASAIPSPQSPTEPGRGDVLARQERMAELERQIEARATWDGPSDVEHTEELRFELSRLRNEGGGELKRYIFIRYVNGRGMASRGSVHAHSECEALEKVKALFEFASGSSYKLESIEEPHPSKVPLPASPSDLPAREAEVEKAFDIEGCSWGNTAARMSLYRNLLALTTTSSRGLVEAAEWHRSGIYIASKCKHADRWRLLRDKIGLPIKSTWIDEAGEGETADFADLWRRNISEACSAEVLIINRERDEVLKGAWIEMGAALACGIPVYAVGIEEFTIAKANGVTHFRHIRDAVDAAKKLVFRTLSAKPTANAGEKGGAQ